MMVITKLFLSFACSALLALTCGATEITDVTTSVILTTLPFVATVDVVYDSSDLTNNTELLFNIFLDDGTLLGNVSRRAWTASQQLLTTFDLDELVVRRPGVGSLNISVASSTSLTNKVSFKSHRISVVPKGVSVIPLLVTLFLAAFSGSTIISLITGIWIAALIEFQDLVEATLRVVDTYILGAIIDPGHTTIIMFTMFLGGMLSMMSRSGGGLGMARFFSSFVTTPQRAQAAAMSAAMCLFFDDYAALLLAGSTMRPITDSQFVSREKLAFIVDSLAAPLSALVPISSWTAFQALLIKDEADKLLDKGYDLKALGFETSGFLGFLRLLPTTFYPIFLVVFQFTVLVTALEFGPMLTAERRARYRHVLIDENLEAEEDRIILADDDPITLPTPNTPRLFFNAIFPIALLVALTIGSMIGIGVRNFPADDPEASSNLFAYTDGVLALLYSTSLTCLFQIVIYRFQFRPRYDKAEHAGKPDERWLYPHRVLFHKIKTALRFDGDSLYAEAEPITGFREGVECWLAGVKTMAPSVVVLVLAWTIGDAMERIGIGRFLASEVSPVLSPSGLPALVFVLCSGVSVATGSSFGTMALMFPIVSPLAFTVSGADPDLYYASLSGILAGSVYGGHISPISDTTILSSMSTRCDLQKHVITQFPYATVCAFWALVVGCIPTGLKTLPPVGTNLLGIFLVIVSVLILGAPVSSPRGRLDLMTYLYAMFRWKILRHNPADVEALRLQVLVIQEEGEKDDVVGQGIRRDYLIWALRRTFESSRFGADELLSDKRKSMKQRASGTPSIDEAKATDAAKKIGVAPSSSAD